MAPTLNILLLGGSGFVGQALLRELATWPAGRVRVRALLRRKGAVPDYPFLTKVSGSLERLPADLEPDAPYVLVHFAVKHIDSDGTGYLATNVEATRQLLERSSARMLGVIYGSSMSVYGNGAQDGVSETVLPRPDTALPISRRLAEKHIEAFASLRGLTAFLLRPRFVVGRGDRFVLPALAKLRRARIGIASGEQRFSVIDVADYARVIVRLAQNVVERQRSGTPVQQALNVGLARPLSFAQLSDVLGAALGLAAPRVRVPVSLRLTGLLRRLPHRAADRLATRLELVGLSHWGDVSALAAAVGDDLIGRDPVDAMRGAVESYHA